MIAPSGPVAMATDRCAPDLGADGGHVEALEEQRRRGHSSCRLDHRAHAQLHHIFVNVSFLAHFKKHIIARQVT
jgi:hypothetical protein